MLFWKAAASSIACDCRLGLQVRARERKDLLGIPDSDELVRLFESDVHILLSVRKDMGAHRSDAPCVVLPASPAVLCATARNPAKALRARSTLRSKSRSNFNPLPNPGAHARGQICASALNFR
jgi:hypothetical protein